MSLYARLVLTITILLLLTTALLTTVLIRGTTDDIITTSRRDLEATTTLLASANTYLLKYESEEVGRNAAIQNMVDKLTGQGNIAFIRVVNENNATLAASTHPLPGYEDRVTDDVDLRLIARAQRDGVPHSELNDNVLRAAAPVLDAQGKLRGAVFVYQSTERIQDTQHTAALRGIGLAALALVASMLASVGLARSIARPVQRLSQAAEALARGKWGYKIPPSGVREITALGQAFTSMAQQLGEIYTELEDKVADRTREVELRAGQIATGAEVSRAASQVLDPDELLQYVVELIRERFDLYYAAVFLMDDTGQDAVLRAGTGEAGRAMLASGHRLPLGDNSMVGWVCANKQARIALDVGAEAIRFANPLLPQTRSELVMPLRLGDRVLGAMDIQSAQAQAFDSNDITALQGMADQIAVALENARLFQQAQSSLKELERANQMLVERGWEAFLHTRPANFAEFHQPGAAPLTVNDVTAIEETTSSDSQGRISIPLKVREQTIGTLIVTAGDGQPNWWTKDRALLELLATQATQAMESARLFEESRQRAGREQMTGEITTRMRETLDVDTVIRTALDEMYRALGLGEIVIRLATQESSSTPPTSDGDQERE
jgi:GAF domain-containing protein/HAMP domain-containing protein